MIKFLFILISINAAQAQNFKMRAREHYEVHTIDNQKFKGLSNTINLGWEKPYEYYYAFSISPIISGLKSKDIGPLGEKIRFLNFGFELKYFVLDKFFVRPAVGYSLLKSYGSLDDLKGYFLYTGIGYEYPFKKFGLAIELAYRYANLSENIEVHSITPSIGFHFYEKF